MLGAAVVKTACKLWLKDNAIAADAAVGVVEIVQAQVADARERRRAGRLFEDLEERVADNVLNNPEFDRLPDNERDAAVLAVADTFDKARLTNRDLFASDLDPTRLYRAVRPLGTRFADSLGAPELYDRILRNCCAYVVEVANALPGFEVGVFGELLARQSEIIRHLDQRFDRLPMQLGGAGAETFEPTYLRLVAKQLDKVELFGVTVSERVGNYPLSVAYVSLSICPRQPVDDPSSGFAVTSIEDALSTSRRAFIRGEAGSGKTTLLQWLAVRCGNRDFYGPSWGWTDSVPLFVRLRRYSGKELPRPEDFLHEVGGSIARTMPLDWMHDLLRTGRALVLVDGVDELPEVQRHRAREWLRELLLAYPKARYVVTTRKTGAAESWLDNEAFDVFEIQPMAKADIEAMVSHWHSAVAEGVADSADLERIETSRRELTRKIGVNRHLRMLAVNPLMTALICALHLDRRMQLPHDRMELYSVALEMLLDRRDTERQIRASEISMSRIDQTLMLQDLAYWLVRNSLARASAERVLERLAAKLSDLHRVHANANEVLRHLLDRSGLLRMPAEGEIDFVHKTFQEFLAGRGAVAADDIGVLVKNAHDDQWHEVVLMAVADGSAQQTDELLRGILARAQEEPGRRYVLQALAVGCIQHTPQLSPELQRLLQEVAAELLPPRRMNQANALAGAGDLVLELLAERTDYSAQEATATIRMAAAIGGDQAIPIIAACARTQGTSVQGEVERAWSKFEPEEFARQVLTGVDYSTLNVDDPSVLPALRNLPVRVLNCAFRHGYGNIDYIREIPTLERFHLRDSHLQSLAPLADQTNLEMLSLKFGTGTVDISPIGRCSSLTEVEIAFDAIADVGQLRGITNIKALQFVDDAPLLFVLENLAQSLRLTHFGMEQAKSMGRHIRILLKAPQLSKLESLRLDKVNYLRTIAGIEQWAETMTAIALNAPRLTDVDQLSSLHRLVDADLRNTPLDSLDFLGDSHSLTHLDIGGHYLDIPDLAPLAALPSLSSLGIWTEQPVDLSGLAGASRLNVTISGPGRIPVSGKGKLEKSVVVRRSSRTLPERY
jgi:hypothetical protein